MNFPASQAERRAQFASCVVRGLATRPIDSLGRPVGQYGATANEAEVFARLATLPHVVPSIDLWASGLCAIEIVGASRARFATLEEKLGAITTASFESPLRDGRGTVVGTVLTVIVKRPTDVLEDVESLDAKGVSLRSTGEVRYFEGDVAELPREWVAYWAAQPALRADKAAKDHADEIAWRAGQHAEQRRRLDEVNRGAVIVLADASLQIGPAFHTFTRGTQVTEPTLIAALRECGIPLGNVGDKAPLRPGQIRFLADFASTTPRGYLSFKKDAVMGGYDAVDAAFFRSFGARIETAEDVAAAAHAATRKTRTAVPA